jgi:hypothetical protein
MRKLLLMLAALIAMGAMPATAAPILIINETGIPGGSCDPLHVTGCTFQLGFAPIDGQLLLSDPGFGVLDVITFTATGLLTGTATIASDGLDGLDDPGDTGTLPPLLHSCVFFVAPCSITMVEPPTQTVSYTPLAGQPGFGGVYTVTSDSHTTDVAEPSSLLLLGAGLLGVVGVMRRKLLG